MAATSRHEGDFETNVITRRELAVLAVVVAVVFGAVLLLVLASSEVAAAVMGPA